MAGKGKEILIVSFCDDMTNGLELASFLINFLPQAQSTVIFVKHMINIFRISF